MAEHSGVEWTDRSHGFWFGCEKVSQGCKHCYAERDMRNYGKNFHTVTRAKGFDKPLTWKEPCKVFVTPWSDFFIAKADAWRADAWDIIRRTPHLTYQILTKRPENISERLPADWGTGYPNVWLGVSVEDQTAADLRIPQLIRIPATVRFLSCEPLLGPINLGRAYPCGYYCDPHVGHVDHSFWTRDVNTYLDWVIVGGESGAQARPMNPEWAEDIREQCERAGHVTFFFKQVGGRKRIHGHWGGDTLYGRTYKEFPRVEPAPVGQMELPLE